MTSKSLFAVSMIIKHLRRIWLRSYELHDRFGLAVPDRGDDLKRIAKERSFVKFVFKVARVHP
jgi:hypothetical protein